MTKETTLTVLDITKAAIDQTPTILANEYVEALALAIIAADRRYKPDIKLTLQAARDYLRFAPKNFAELFEHLNKVATGNQDGNFVRSSNRAALNFAFGFGVAHQTQEELFKDASNV